MTMDWNECSAVCRDPNRMHGAWTFVGTRVPVAFLFENLDAGATTDEFVEWFEGVTPQQVHAVLEFVGRTARTTVAA
jgi:uncharacterized protein (DUF433 family)